MTYALHYLSHDLSHAYHLICHHVTLTYAPPPPTGQHRGQVLMSETDSEDDVLFDKKSNSSETPPPGYNNLGNGKISSKASSLVRGLIPH